MARFSKELPESIFYAVFANGKVRGPYDGSGPARAAITAYKKRNGGSGELVEFELNEINRSPWPTPEKIQEEKERAERHYVRQIERKAAELERQLKVLEERKEKLAKYTYQRLNES